MPVIFDTNDFPADTRFARWRDCASNLFLPVDVASRDPEAFRYRTARSAVDGLAIGSSLASHVQVRREPRHIGDPAACPLSIYIPTGGRVGIAQAGSERRSRPGELTLIDTARPYELDVFADLAFTWLHVPRDRLPCRFGSPEALAGLTLGPRNPYARLAIDFIRSMAGVADQLSGKNARRVADQALDLVAMAVAHQAEGAGMAPQPAAESRRAAVLHEAKAFMDRNLPDADLSLERVAAALDVSPRYLSGLFSDAETPYRTYLREQRLAQCALDLAAPQLAHRSVTDIALSWGFVDPAHFSRSFKARYGQSPSDYRAERSRETIHAAPGAAAPGAAAQWAARV